jgi:inositol oxygenase
MIRYHSFYPWHQEGAYGYFMNGRDREMLEWVRRFNPYDLYSKGAERPDADKLRPYYEELIAEFFPAELRW